MFELSVILCTHNPRPDIIVRTLDALKRQSLAVDRWELLLVDSCSQPPLSERLDLSWHPHARLIEEVELGANAARQAAFRECRGQVLVIVDDDNFLEPTYLETALTIAERWPQLGAWGGSIVGEFEEPPPDWLSGIAGNLAIREVTREEWTNIEPDFLRLPFGAGMCLRRVVADRYREDVARNPLKRCLGRRGDYHVSGEDPDIACTAFDLGLGVGLFPKLKMRHFMPAARVQQAPVLQTARGNVAALTLLQHLRGRLNRSHLGLLRRVRSFLHFCRMPPFERRLQIACLQGHMAVLRTIRQFEHGELSTAEEFRVAYNKNVRRTFLEFPW